MVEEAFLVMDGWILLHYVTSSSNSNGDKIAINLLHDVFDFVLFTVQDDASLLTDLQVLKHRAFNSIQHQSS